MCQDRLTLKTKHPEITHTEDIHLIVLICNKHLKMKKQKFSKSWKIWHSKQCRAGYSKQLVSYKCLGICFMYRDGSAIYN